MQKQKSEPELSLQEQSDQITQQELEKKQKEVIHKTPKSVS